MIVFTLNAEKILLAMLIEMTFLGLWMIGLKMYQLMRD